MRVNESLLASSAMFVTSCLLLAATDWGFLNSQEPRSARVGNTFSQAKRTSRA